MLTSGSDIWYTPGIAASKDEEGTPVPLPVTVRCAHSGYLVECQRCMLAKSCEKLLPLRSVARVQSDRLVADEVVASLQILGDGHSLFASLVSTAFRADSRRWKRTHELPLLIISPEPQRPLERVPEMRPACSILNQTLPVPEKELQEPPQLAIQTTIGPILCGHGLFQYAVMELPAATVALSAALAPLRLQVMPALVGSWIGLYESGGLGVNGCPCRSTW